MSSNNNKRIAKNTVFLYLRMLLIMAVSLYTSRIVLNTLGVEDFGIYNIVGGIITLLGFFSNSMVAATQRFLSYEIGRKNPLQLSKIFNVSINAHFIIALVILVVAETFGLWFVNNHLTIPVKRTAAANWVYQFTIFSYMITVITAPYIAAIVANERMNVYAWVSIIDVSLKLFFVFILQWIGLDKLKLYSVLMFCITLTSQFIYVVYCSRSFSESKLRFFWDNSLLKTLLIYTSWNLWGNAAGAMIGQGINILLNIFFGPIINAARGIAYQVCGAVSSFVYNFQTAMNPQIIKSFASGEIKYMHQLIYYGAKYSFFLLFALSLPILLETEIILKLWLKMVPEYTLIFTQLVIINILIDSISGPLMTAAQASGKIRLYQGVVGILLLSIIPISFLFLKNGFEPQTTIYVNISISIIALITRLLIISRLVNLSIREYIKKVILKIIPVTLISIIIPLIIRSFLTQGFYRLMITLCISLISVSVTIFYIGLDRPEKNFVQNKIKQFLLCN